MATHKSSPVAQGGSGQDKTGGPARALDTSSGDSRHRIRAVKEKVGLEREVQRKSSLLGKAGGTGGFRNEKAALSFSIFLPFDKC